MNLAPNDLKIRLTNGTVVGVNLTGATTIQDVLTAIHAASARLTATVNATGDGIDVVDSINDGVAAVQGSSVSSLAADLGLAVTGVGHAPLRDGVVGRAVVLNGGSTILLSLLNGGAGVRVTDLEQVELTGATLLADLNQGAGVASVAGADFRITLTDGTTVDVDLAGATLTVQQAMMRSSSRRTPSRRPADRRHRSRVAELAAPDDALSLGWSTWR